MCIFYNSIQFAIQVRNLSKRIDVVYVDLLIPTYIEWLTVHHLTNH